jgi:hypothetical protein
MKGKYAYSDAQGLAFRVVHRASPWRGINCQFPEDLTTTFETISRCLDDGFSLFDL